jgi:hypothetical protein
MVLCDDMNASKVSIMMDNIQHLQNGEILIWTMPTASAAQPASTTSSSSVFLIRHWCHWWRMRRAYRTLLSIIIINVIALGDVFE